jgi:hypothetical protein
MGGANPVVGSCGEGVWNPDVVEVPRVPGLDGQGASGAGQGQALGPTLAQGFPCIGIEASPVDVFVFVTRARLA